mmetsp:Transcript_47034/g.99961  ORF Transcript_47034/g.99961 Transcript_47034/m.99961 type:complete len:147 (-) Transcript_47034:224-664(-)
MFCLIQSRNLHVITLNRYEVDMPGMPISETEWDSLQEQLKVEEGERSLSYFLRSLNCLYLIGDNSFWHRCLKNDRAPKELVNELKSACGMIDHSASVGNDAEDNESSDVTYSPISRSRLRRGPRGPPQVCEGPREPQSLPSQSSWP